MAVHLTSRPSSRPPAITTPPSNPIRRSNRLRTPPLPPTPPQNSSRPRQSPAAVHFIPATKRARPHSPDPTSRSAPSPRSLRALKRQKLTQCVAVLPHLEHRTSIRRSQPTLSPSHDATPPSPPPPRKKRKENALLHDARPTASPKRAQKPGPNDSHASLATPSKPVAPSSSSPPQSLLYNSPGGHNTQLSSPLNNTAPNPLEDDDDPMGCITSSLQSKLGPETLTSYVTYTPLSPSSSTSTRPPATPSPTNPSLPHNSFPPPSVNDAPPPLLLRLAPLSNLADPPFSLDPELEPTSFGQYDPADLMHYRLHEMQRDQDFVVREREQKERERRESNIWKAACKERVDGMLSLYDPATIRAVVAAQADTPIPTMSECTDSDSDYDEDEEDPNSRSPSSSPASCSPSRGEITMSPFDLSGFPEFDLDLTCLASGNTTSGGPNGVSLGCFLASPTSSMPPPSSSQAQVQGHQQHHQTLHHQQPHDLFSPLRTSSLNSSLSPSRPTLPYPPPPLSTLRATSLVQCAWPKYTGRGTPPDRARRDDWARRWSSSGSGSGSDGWRRSEGGASDGGMSGSGSAAWSTRGMSVDGEIVDPSGLVSVLGAHGGAGAGVGASMGMGMLNATPAEWSRFLAELFGSGGAAAAGVPGVGEGEGTVIPGNADSCNASGLPSVSASVEPYLSIPTHPAISHELSDPPLPNPHDESTPPHGLMLPGGAGVSGGSMDWFELGRVGVSPPRAAAMCPTTVHIDDSGIEVDVIDLGDGGVAQPPRSECFEPAGMGMSSSTLSFALG